MYSGYLDEIKRILSSIKRSPSFYNFCKNMRGINNEEITNIAILNSLIEGNSLETIAVEFNIRQAGQPDYIAWRVLNNTALLFTKSNNQDSLSSLGLQLRVLTALTRAGFYTITDLVKYLNDGKDLKMIRNLGKSSAETIQRRLVELSVTTNKEPSAVRYILYSETRKLYYSGQNKWGSLGDAHLYKSKVVADNACSKLRLNNLDVVSIKKVGFSLLN